MWRTLFLCIFKLTCSLFRLTRWCVKLRLLAAFLHIWQQANRKFIQRTFYKFLIKRLLCLCCSIQCVRFRLLCSSPCSRPSRRELEPKGSSFKRCCKGKGDRTVFEIWNNILQLRDEELNIMKIIAVVDATFAKAKRKRLWDSNVKLGAVF